MQLNRSQGLACLLVVALIGPGLPAAMGAESDGVSDTGAASTAGPQLEVVVVNGLRDSLARSLQEKQNASVVEDSINALELGRFPDDDVADSLRHVTGVSISRTTGGEGQYV